MDDFGDDSGDYEEVFDAYEDAEEEEEEHIYESVQSDWLLSDLEEEEEEEGADGRMLLLRSAIWSDCGARVRTSYEFWHSKVSSLDRRAAGDWEGNYKHLSTKFASESNIEDALVMMEPGLRRIPKDTDYTTEEEEDEDELEHLWQEEKDTCPYPYPRVSYFDARALQCHHHLHQQQQPPDPDSGFSSYHNHHPGAASSSGAHLPTASAYVTVIPVNQPQTSCSSESNPSYHDTRVTVNGVFLDSGQVLPHQQQCQTSPKDDSETTVVVGL